MKCFVRSWFCGEQGGSLIVHVQEHYLCGICEQLPLFGTLTIKNIKIIGVFQGVWTKL